MYKILSESAEFCRRCDKNIFVYQNLPGFVEYMTKIGVFFGSLIIFFNSSVFTQIRLPTMGCIDELLQYSCLSYSISCLLWYCL